MLLNVDGKHYDLRGFLVEDNDQGNNPNFTLKLFIGSVTSTVVASKTNIEQQTIILNLMNAIINQARSYEGYVLADELFMSIKKHFKTNERDLRRHHQATEQRNTIALIADNVSYILFVEPEKLTPRHIQLTGRGNTFSLEINPSLPQGVFPTVQFRLGASPELRNGGKAKDFLSEVVNTFRAIFGEKLKEARDTGCIEMSHVIGAMQRHYPQLQFVEYNEQALVTKQ